MTRPDAAAHADLFERLKKPRSFGKPRPVIQDLQFQLGFDPDQRAYVAVLDGRRRAVAGVDFRAYAGAVRQALKRIEGIEARGVRRLDWGAGPPLGAVWLDEDEALMADLLAIGRLLDPAGRRIEARAETGEVALQVERSDGAITCRPVVALPDGGHEPIECMISGTWALTTKGALRLRPFGDCWRDLAQFRGRLPMEDLETCLSLCCSRFDGIRILFEEYAQVEGPAVLAKPAIGFETVGPGCALHLRVGCAAAPLPPQCFADYDIGRVVRVDHAARCIAIHEATQCDLGEAIKTIRQILNRVTRGLKGGPGTFYTQDHDLLILERDLAAAFLEQELAALMSRFALFGSEKLVGMGYRVHNPSIKLGLMAGKEWLWGTVELDFGAAGRLPLEDALTQWRRQGWLALGDGTRCLPSQTYIERLQRVFTIETRRAGLSFFDLPILDGLWRRKAESPAIEKARAFYRAMGQLDRIQAPPPRIQGALRPYQALGFRWLWHLHDHALGGCLSDEMGLGKTIQALALLSVIHPEAGAPSLIVMPAALLDNWRREIEVFVPQLRAGLYYGPGRDLGRLTSHDLILTTYAVVRRDMAAFKAAGPFHCVVLDEAQTIKNRTSQTARAICRLPAKRRLALSGTPLENHLGDLFSLCRFLNPNMLGSAKTFDRRYARPIQKDGDREAAADLRRKVHPFILRRLKDDVLPELPAKTERTLYVAMDAAHRRWYEACRARHRDAVKRALQRDDRGQVFFLLSNALTALRQAASIPEVESEGAVSCRKRALLTSRLVELAASGRKALVFVNFLGALDLIGADLDAAGVPHLTLSSKTARRDAVIDRFQRDPAVKVLAMTLKTGGVGLNLTQADTVFLFDPWWTRAAERQATDRAHRIGQTRPVFTYRLIVQDTVEAGIEALQQRKLALIDDLIPQDGASGKRLSDEDIAFLLDFEA